MTQEVEVGGPQVQGQPGKLSKILFQKEKRRKKYFEHTHIRVLIFIESFDVCIRRGLLLEYIFLERESTKEISQGVKVLSLTYEC